MTIVALHPYVAKNRPRSVTYALFTGIKDSSPAAVLAKKNRTPQKPKILKEYFPNSRSRVCNYNHKEDIWKSI